MGILTKRQILERIKNGSIVVEPTLDEFQLRSHAIDLRLGYTFLIPRQWHMTAKGREALSFDYMSDKNNAGNFEVIELEKGQMFELLPGEHVLASTLETITWPDDVMSVLYPRSSTNRRGLSVDLTGIIDTGYSGQLIIPIRNNTLTQTIAIYPGERFCQVTFEELSEPTKTEKSTYHQKDIIEGFTVQNKYKDEVRMIRDGEIEKIKKEFRIDTN